ncbi:MAG: hypothetical protein IKO85_05070 [Bacteroidaceae bacterium]|nr:hypothetical protein [Bacteroidaceae bacterium]
MARPRTLLGRISGATGTYLGNRGRQRDTNARGNRLTNHAGQYRNIRAAMGLSTG